MPGATGDPSQHVSGQTSGQDGRKAAERAPLTPEQLERRWELVLPYRAEMLAVARWRVPTREDAEDVVATAMLRTVEYPGLDESRAAAFLCTTVKRLAVDVHRDRSRQLATGVRDAGRAVAPAPFEEVIADEHEARWLVRRLDSAPQREREVLAARLAGSSTAAASEQLGLSMKATENAYTRLRHRAHQILAAAGTAMAVLLGAGRKISKPAAMVPVVALTAVGLALVSPAAPGSDGFSPSPANPIEIAAASGGTQPGVDAPVIGTPPAPLLQTAPTRSAPSTSTVPAAPASPSPERTVILPPTSVVDPEFAEVGGVYVEERRTDETFEESVQHCVQGLEKVLADPTSDPCA